VKKDEIDTALGYFENNAPRMRYHWFRQCGLPARRDAGPDHFLCVRPGQVVLPRLAIAVHA
jgi:hypothetical protein